MFIRNKIKPWAVIFLSLLLHCHFSYAQTKVIQNSTKVETIQLAGKTLESKDFQLSSLKGKVSLVMFWSTDCPVCRDQMPELRENIQGWANKPFELVLVSTDKNMKDVTDYYAVLKQVAPFKQRFTQLWAGDASYKDSINAKQIPIKQLPATFLLDKNGRVIGVFFGRIPAQAWDEIADLL